jgi:MATE family multidrug resistance protein
VKPTLIVYAVSATLSIPITYIIAITLDTGFVGAAWSLVAMSMFSALLCIFVVYFKKLGRESWRGWSWDCIYEWKTFVHLSFSGLFMVCLEWWSFEIGSFVAGTVSEADLAAYAILLQILTVTYAGSYGLSLAGSIRVGYWLGAGKPNEAKQAAWLTVKLNFAWGVIIAAILTSLCTSLGQIFTSNKDVLNLTKKILLLMGFTELIDSLQICLAGILMGSGRQKFGAIINFVGYYIIGIPLGTALALQADMGVLGVCIGMSSSIVFQCLSQFVVVYRTNWEHQAKQAVARVKSASGEHSIPLTNEEDIQPQQTEELSEEEDITALEPEIDDSKKSLLLEMTLIESATSEEDKDKSLQQECTRPPFARVLCQRLLLFGLGMLLLIGAGIGSIYHPSNSRMPICSIIHNGSMSTCSDNGNVATSIPTVQLQPSQSLLLSSAVFSEPRRPSASVYSTNYASSTAMWTH